MKTACTAILAAAMAVSSVGLARPLPGPQLAARLADGPEIIGIVHWGLNTYTDREWGFGDEDPAMLNPAKFDADQIVGACKAGGIGGLVVVAKHHDGFCLWPTKTTEHNITKTPFWKCKDESAKCKTSGDYVKEMEQACRRAGLKFGVYVSPWDRNNAHYGTEKYVTDVFQQQLRELLSGDYGEIFEMWFDGANGGDGYYGGAREKRKIPDGYYRYDTETFAMVRKLQPKVCIFNEMDEADFRFGGNERGLVDPDSRATGGHYDGVWENYKKWSNTGLIDGSTFHPIEADFPLRKGWFYHEKDRGTTKSAAYLTKLYLSSVGNAATMNIGIAPNKDGLLDADDVKALAGFKTLKDALFAHEVTTGGSQYPATVGEPFNVVVVREDISRGEQVDEWEFVADGKAILRGKSIGVKRIRVLETPCTAKSCEVKVLKDGGALQGVSFKLYRADHELVRLVLSSTTESGETDTAKWMTAPEVVLDAKGVVVNGDVICEVERRTFPDGEAVRYRLPDGVATVSCERTEWRLPADAHIWYQPQSSCYEAPFKSCRVGEISAREKMNLPITAKLADGTYRLLTEANVVDYTDSCVEYCGDGRFAIRYYADEKGFARSGVPHTPWRVTLVAKDLQTLATSDIVRRLCPDPSPEVAAKCAAFVKGGRSVWQWLPAGDPKYGEQKEWYDRTKALGFEYYLVDDGWKVWRDGDMDQWACLKKWIDYGKSIGVESFVWVDSKEMRTTEARREYLKKVKGCGAVGIKIDFVPEPSCSQMKWYEETLADTLEFSLMTDFHGCVKPSGRERTWPHEVAREAIRGHEWHITRYSRVLPPEHDCILPFNRLVQGHADYTPMVFEKKELQGYTWARELAQGVVFSARFLCFGDYPQNYLDNPAVELIKSMPAEYDETRILPGSEIGKCVVVAKRKGRDWFVAVENGAEERRIVINLDFLDADNCELLGFADAEDRSDGYRIDRRAVERDGKIELMLRPCGGYCARISPAKGSTFADKDGSCPVSTNIRGHENIEWSTAYAFGLTDETKDLPRVLLVGDSICNGYQEGVRERLKGKVNVSYWVSSYCATSAAYLPLLTIYLDEAKYDVIHFNNGLHSLETSTDAWTKGFKAALELIRRKQPEAKIVWCTSTPLTDETKTAKSRELNAAGAMVVAELGGIATNDLFALCYPLDRATNWSDTCHFRPEAKTKQADQVAASVLSALNAYKRPVPGPQLAARLAEGPEIIGIVHWGLNTFTDREWGYGNEDPALLNPTNFSADQIVGACKAGGIGGLVVVAKHHDGFCLWPTKTTEHNITKTPFWKCKDESAKCKTSGDYVKEMEQACRRAGLKFGVYCSPWDRNNAAYATPEYVKTYHAQVEELNDGRYGEIFEMWFDGANGGDGYYGGAWEKRSIGKARDYYQFGKLWDRVRELQPNVCFFGGRDGFTWPGNESGVVPPESGGTRDDGTFQIYEADFPLRPGWFYHKSQDGYSRSGEFLMKIYLRTVGNGAVMDIGIAPDRRGRLTDEDAECLRRFSEIRKKFFSKPVADVSSPFNVIQMKEDVRHGERVDEWRVLLDGREVAKGGKIGTKRIRVLDAPVSGNELKLEIVKGDAKADEIKMELFAADEGLVRKVMASEEPKRPPSPFERKGVLTSRTGDTLVFMMKNAKETSSLLLTLDPDKLDGTPVAFRLAFSADGEKWEEDGVEYHLDNIAANPIPQKVELGRGVKVKYLRLKAVRTLKDHAAVHLKGLDFVF